ncbi:MAG: tetratricopeptide repeat protein, partial [Candidatus Hydrogenedentes bacterium]|nr:tetratricopeptide repeat protein [Candidatus Hydrogenedentota bacterium]
RREEAIQECRRIIEKHPQVLGAYTMLAAIYSESYDFDNAVTFMEEAVRLSPRNPIARLKAAMLYQMTGDIDKAIAEYEQAVLLSPNSVVALNNLAYFYAEEKNRFDDALNIARRAYGLAPDDPSVADTLGWIYYRKGSYELAVPPLEKAVTVKPDNATLQFHLGMAYLKSGETNEGSAHLKKALEIDPGFPDAGEASRALESITEN